MLKHRIRSGLTYWRGEGLGPFLVRSVAGSGAVQLTGMAIGFLVGVQLAPGLGVSGYGYYGIAMAAVTLATMPGTLGLPGLVTREVSAALAREDLPALFGVLRWADRMSWHVSAVVTAAMAIWAIVTWRFVSATAGAAILFGVPMIALLPLSGIRGGALRGLHYVVLGQLSNAVVRPLAMCLLLLAALARGIGIGAPTAMALNSITALGALLLTQQWLSHRLPKDRPSDSHVDGRGWLASTIPMALSNAVYALEQQLAVIFLGILFAPAVAGLFRVSISILPLIVVPVSIINMVVLPSFARLHTEGDYRTLQKLVTSSARTQFVGVTLISLPLLVAAGPLLGFVFGGGYVPAGNTLRVLVFGAMVSAAFGPNAALLNMTGHERRVTRAVGIALVVNMFALAILAHWWGSVGAAIGVLAGQCCWNVLLWLDARRLLGIETSLSKASRH